MSLEANKILAGALVAGITAMVGGLVASALVSPTVPEKNVIGIEAVESHGVSDVVAPEAKDPPFDPAMMASADATRGEQIAKACLSCHTFDKDGPNKVGPNMWGVVGAKHAHHPTFAYSDAMKALHSEDWTYAKLYDFVHAPKQTVPGTKMSFAGVRKVQDRYDLLMWMRSKSDAPVPLP